jgi:hypothetical protein
MFTISDIGHVEDNSFSVTLNRTGRKVICADTGNGGATAYQLLAPTHGDPCDRYNELGYAATHREAEEKAKLHLTRN